MDWNLPSFPVYNPEIDYLDEIFKLSFQYEALTQERDVLLREVQDLWNKVQKREKKLFGAHRRRKNLELKKFYDCPHSHCNKSYAYKSSLVTHLKRKHSE